MWMSVKQVVCVLVYRHCVLVGRGNYMWSKCAAGCFVCLCIGIVCLWVEGIKCG